MKVLIKERLSQHKYKTPEGYLICTDAILARTGKQEYRRNEVFADTDDTSIIQIDRREEDVFADATLASFENKPITVEHPSENVTPDNYRYLSVGYVRNVRKGDFQGQPVMIGDLVITDADIIKDIEEGIRTELSCGYDCDIKDDNGLYQSNIRGNHVALCEQGRAGIAKIVDSTDDSTKVEDARKWEVGQRVRYEGSWWYVVNYSRGQWVLEPEHSDNPYERIYVDDSIDAKDGIEEKQMTIDDLIADEEEAIEGYKKAMASADETHKAIYAHIIKEELEHIEELKSLKELSIGDINIVDKPADAKDIDTSNYVEAHGIWFARPKGKTDEFDIAYCSNDKGKTWHTCFKEVKSVNPNRGGTQVGKVFFRVSNSFDGPRTSIGRNVLTWYAANGIHRVDESKQIDHIDGNYKNDKLSNLRRVTAKENMKYAAEMRKQKSDANSYTYRGITIIKSSYGWKFILGGSQYEVATDNEAEEIIDAHFDDSVNNLVKSKHKLTKVISMLNKVKKH